MSTSMDFSHDKLKEWAKLAEECDLPNWDEFPTLDLYMDQVVSLLTQYIKKIEPVVGADRPITSAMVNNYVKMKLIPAPIKKRYDRRHLACLIMVCILKRTLSMSAIQTLVPLELDEEEMKLYYNNFCESRRKGVESGISQILAEKDSFNTDNKENYSLAVSYAVRSSLFKSVSEKLVYDETSISKE